MSQLVDSFRKIFLKSNDADADDMGEVENDDKPSPDEDDLLKKAYKAMDAGELSEDEDVLGEWAQSNGVRDHKSFAKRAMKGYYAKGGMKKSTFSPEQESELAQIRDALAGGISDFRKSLNGLNSDAELALEGLAGVVESMESIESRLAAIEERQGEVVETVRKSEAEIERIGSEPVEPKSPVFESRTAPTKPSGGHSGVTMKQIQKGLGAGILTVEDVRQFELNGAVTDRAREYLESQKES